MCTGKAIWARFRRTPPLQPDVRMPSKSCSTRADWMRSIVATIRDTLRSTLRLFVSMQSSFCRIKARNCSLYRSQTWSERRYGQYEMPTNMNNKRALRAVLLAILCMSAALCASAQRLTRRAHAVLARVDSVRSSEYDARLADFLASLKPIEQRIATLRARVKGMPITATEPLADYLTQALGLRMRNARFQRAIMKGSEPSVADTAAFEDD